MNTILVSTATLFLLLAIPSFASGVSGRSGSHVLASAKTSKVLLAKKRLLELFAICRTGDYERAARYIVYRGTDSVRKWKTVYSNSEPEDREAVTRICLRIKEFLEQKGELVFDGSAVQKESEGEWVVWTVSHRDVHHSRASFAFLKVKGSYSLGDID